MIAPADIIHFLNEEIQGVKTRSGGNPNAVQSGKIDMLSAARDYISSHERSSGDRRASA